MSNSKKQTAVEWLVEQMIYQMDIRIENTTIGCELFEQTKEMERQQNEYTWIAGAEYALSFLKDKTSKDSKESFKQYYNETYGNNK